MATEVWPPTVEAGLTATAPGIASGVRLDKTSGVGVTVTDADPDADADEKGGLAATTT